jgi:hypothetical protein
VLTGSHCSSGHGRDTRHSPESPSCRSPPSPGRRGTQAGAYGGEHCPNEASGGRIVHFNIIMSLLLHTC